MHWKICNPRDDLVKFYTTEPKEKYEYKGFVYTSVVLSKNIILDVGSGLKNIVGGELNSYTDLVEQAIFKAMKKIEEQASKKDANAVIGLRFSTSSVARLAAEVIVYGTAVKIKGE